MGKTANPLFNFDPCPHCFSGLIKGYVCDKCGHNFSVKKQKKVKEPKSVVPTTDDLFKVREECRKNGVSKYDFMRFDRAFK